MYLYMNFEIGGYVLSKDVNVFCRLSHSAKNFFFIKYLILTSFTSRFKSILSKGTCCFILLSPQMSGIQMLFCQLMRIKDPKAVKMNV